MDITKLRKNSLFVGRAATAIYLILHTLMKEKEVILPSNICYAAVYPIIYSGNVPVFVDIDKNTGNAPFEKILEKINSNTGAIIFPYMYGNVAKDILKLKEYCQSNGIVLIEDCASVMNAKVENKNVGTIGDYAVFSTGHAKIIDVGNGGILLTDKNIDSIIEEYNKLDLYNDKIGCQLNEFSKQYRILRNEENDKKIKEFFNKNYRNLFLYKIDQTVIDKMKKELENEKNIKEERTKKYKMFKNSLHKSDLYELLEFEEGSTPWRFTMLIKNKTYKKELIQIVLENKLFVSDWYPCIGKSFSDDIYPNSDNMEKEILNFSLTDDEENILKICEIINDYFRRKN